MRYIRTTKNIFEVVGETELVYRIIGASRERNNVYSRTKKLNDVIKQADTIEELCDEFVEEFKITDKDLFEKNTEKYKYVRKHFDKPYIWLSNYFLDYKAQEIYEQQIQVRKTLGIKCDLYGAIWTDKGLIYVAKMNEKGELELL